MNTDASKPAIGREITLSSQHLALLFALFGQAPPPAVSDALSGFPTFMFREKMQRVEAEMIANGTLQRAADGRAELTEDVAELLAMCFDSDDAVTFEVDGSSTVTAYFTADSTAAISESAGEVLLAEVRGPDGREAWFSDHFTHADCYGDSEAFAVDMTAEELDELLTASSEGGPTQVEAVCADHGWGRDRIVSVLEVVLGDGPLLKTTAVRSGLPGMAVSRLGLSANGAWVLKVVAMSESDSAELGWYPSSDLLDAIRDFKGA
jgi:hypothetical protein